MSVRQTSNKMREAERSSTKSVLYSSSTFMHRSANSWPEQIFSHDPSTYVAITAHGGTIASLLRVVKHPPVQTQTGSLTPVIVKARRAVQRHERPINNVGTGQRVFDSLF